MEETLKRRLIGAAVVVSLGVIFLPMILDGGRHTDFEKIRIEIPAPPERGFSSTIEPLSPAATPKPVQPAKTDTDIDKAGKAPTIDSEISQIITPIEPATEVVNKPEVQKPVTVVPDKAPKSPTEVPKKPAPSSKVDKPSSAEISTVSPVSAWVVQVGSFDSRENAVILRDSLRKLGFIAFVESFEKSGTPSHRVRIGPEVERSKAESTLASLQKKTSLSGIIVSYP